MPPVSRYTVRRIAATKGPRARRSKLWDAIRILRHFTVGELMAVTEQEPEKKHSVLTYLSQLRRAGYLRARYGSTRRGEPAQFTLIRNTGPEAPGTVNRGTAMWDWNNETEYPIKGINHVE